MRRCSLVLLLALLGCAGGSGNPSSGNVAPTTTTPTPGDPSNPQNPNDPISGDGEIKGDPDTSSSDHGTAAMAPAASAGASSPGAGGGASSSSGGAGAGSSGGSGGSSGSGGNGVIPAGILTAGAWDDNRNFDFFTRFRADVAATQPPGLLPIPDDEYARSHDAALVAPAPKGKLDVSLMIDTTGSMGDEIAYLQREFEALAQTIQSKYPGAEQHWSLVLYKDIHDPYIVRWFDFRADTVEFQTKLATAEASGGGDFPESPDQALGVAHRLSWRTDPDTARLLFWVADAPHHDDRAQEMADAIRATRDRGIHIYPVAASGIDDFTEHTMRSAAELTGGRYLFLTDDSGVGNTHKEPRIPCYFVTKLDRAILRMVDIELSATYHEPAPDEILRTGGNPSSGVCSLSGVTTTIY
jgi:hypothetical protein